MLKVSSKLNGAQDLKRRKVILGQMYKRNEQSTIVSFMNRQKIDAVPLGLIFFF